MQKAPYSMVMDVESMGLYGLGWAFGYVVMDKDFVTVEEGYSCSNPTHVALSGSAEDYEWVKQNIVPHCPVNRSTLYLVQEDFWTAWIKYQKLGAELWADCCFPVEAKFLTDGVELSVARKPFAPYPLFDIATLLFAKGYDPTATFARIPDELPAHNPLHDARQSARILKALLTGETLEGKG